MTTRVVPPVSAISRFLDRVRDALADGSFVRLVLAGPVPPPPAPRKALARLIELRGAPHLSVTLRHPTRDLTHNLPVAQAVDWIRGEVGPHFRTALLGTTHGDWQLFAPAAGPARLVGHAPACTAPPPRQHDQPRQSVLDARATDWLQGLGIVGANGRVRAAMADKHRQLSRYLEILGHLARECGWESPAPTPIALADMGCGKGYLTVGAWHLLTRVLGRTAHVLGVEARPDLVAAANRLAKTVATDGLEFAAGTIATVALPRLDALVALHACNTATDDAISRGIELGARLVVVAPCCHQQVRPQLDAVLRSRPPAGLGPLAPVLRHGLMTERLAEWATDGLRGLFLEWAGYRTKLFEFVASEHTPKNLMIAAVRERPGFDDPVARDRIVTFKEWLGLGPHPLDPLLERRPA